MGLFKLKIDVSHFSKYGIGQRLNTTLPTDMICPIMSLSCTCMHNIRKNSCARMWTANALWFYLKVKGCFLLRFVHSWQEHQLEQKHLLDVPSQPHGGEVAPSKLPNDVVTSIEEISDFHKVVTPWKNTRTRNQLWGASITITAAPLNIFLEKTTEVC